MHKKIQDQSCAIMEMTQKLSHRCTWVVAVMESTKVGTVEQLRFNRRPCRGRKNNSRLDYTGKRFLTSQLREQRWWRCSLGKMRYVLEKKNSII